MGLLNRLSNLVKGEEKRKAEAEAVQNASAEQELQKIFTDPEHLYKLCFALTTEDQLKFFKQCEVVKSGKVKVGAFDSKMKSSDLLQATLKCEENSENKKDRLEKLAQENKDIKDLLQQTFIDTTLKTKFFEENKKFKREISQHRILSKTESTMAWGVLMIGITSGRIKDINQIQKLSMDAKADLQKRAKELGLAVETQNPVIQKSGESR